MALISSFGADGSPIEFDPSSLSPRAPVVQLGNSYSVGYGVSFDRSQWDALFMRLTGAPPGRATEESANRALDPAIKRAALKVRRLLAADTPVLTGRLKASWLIQRLRAARYDVENRIPYAAIVESRAPGGPAKGRGAMIAQNLAKIADILKAEVQRQLDFAIQGAAIWDAAQAAEADELDIADAYGPWLSAKHSYRDGRPRTASNAYRRILSSAMGRGRK